METDSLALYEDAEGDNTSPEPKLKKPKVARPTDADGVPILVQGDELDIKGVEAWLRKVTDDKLIGEMWKLKAKSITPATIGKEMTAAINNDQSRLQISVDRVSTLTIAKDLNGINSAVKEGHNLLKAYQENILACSRYAKAPPKASSAKKKAKP